jgi:trans-aconitate methyltransferase
MTAQATRDVAYFDSLYRDDPDPWRFTTSDYERDKYQATIDALGDRRFANALEIGCSIGVLTRQLAQRCDRLLSIDISETPLAAARERCADQTHVEFRRLDISAEWPAGRFDLVVLSEVIYFLSAEDVVRTARHVVQSAAPGACVLLVNWLGLTDYPCGGDEAAHLFIESCRGAFTVAAASRNDSYRLDLLVAPLN